jgi:haloalkane dehalogenase
MIVTRGYAEGPFGQLHYYSCGNGSPLVLLHQSATSAVQFQNAFELLANAGIQVVAVDLPGFGMSERTAEPPSIADYATIVPAILDHFNLDSANLLGHHTGSMIANEAALNWPDRVNKVIHNGPVPFSPEERQNFIDTALDFEKDWKPAKDGSHLQAMWNLRAGATPGWSNLESMNRQVIHALLAGEHMWWAHAAVFAYDQQTALEKLTGPNLILTNTGDGIYFLALRAKELRPDFDYVEIEGGTHDIVDEQPEMWAQAVIKYINT